MQNHRRVLAEVLSIDAWHDPIKVDGSTSAVHVELSFQQGRLGGDDSEFPFTFNIALKRALLTVQIEQPLVIDRRSIARPNPNQTVEITKLHAAREEAQSSIAYGAKLSPASVAAFFSASAKTDANTKREDQLKLVQAVPRIIASPRPKGEREYSWELLPSYEETLDGQPWDPVENPRLSVRGPRERGALDPVISVHVSCKLEDIQITDLTLKRSTGFGLLRDMLFDRVNEAAAIQHLKLVLRDRYLEVGHMDDRYSEVGIADVLSIEAP